MEKRKRDAFQIIFPKFKQIKINRRNSLVPGRGYRGLKQRPTDGSLGPAASAAPSALLERNYLRLYGFMGDLLFYTDEYFV